MAQASSLKKLDKTRSYLPFPLPWKVLLSLECSLGYQLLYEKHLSVLLFNTSKRKRLEVMHMDVKRTSGNRV